MNPVPVPVPVPVGSPRPVVPNVPVPPTPAPVSSAPAASFVPMPRAAASSTVAPVAVPLPVPVPVPRPVHAPSLPQPKIISPSSPMKPTITKPSSFPRNATAASSLSNAWPVSSRQLAPQQQPLTVSPAAPPAPATVDVPAPSGTAAPRPGMASAPVPIPVPLPTHAAATATAPAPPAISVVAPPRVTAISTFSSPFLAPPVPTPAAVSTSPSTGGAPLPTPLPPAAQAQVNTSTPPTSSSEAVPPGAAATEASAADQSIVVPAPSPDSDSRGKDVPERERATVDYSVYVLSVPHPKPATVAGIAKATPLGISTPQPGIVAGPHALAVDPVVVAAAVPAPLPPSSVVFGGAKYESGAFLTCPPSTSPLPRPTAHEDPMEEWTRLQFMIDQLTLAKNYLKLETDRTSRALLAVSAASSAKTDRPQANVAGGAAARVAGDGEEDVDFAKANIWTVSFGGSPRQLQECLDKSKTSDAVRALGRINLHHRQWGLKKNGETYQLGLGMKGTPLQFAALAGRLDNVLLLLANGACDNVEPRLKALLTPESYRLVAQALKPKRAAARRAPLRSGDAIPGEGNADAGIVPSTEEEAQPSGDAVTAPAFPAPLVGLPPPPAMPHFTHVSVQPVSFTL